MSDEEREAIESLKNIAIYIGDNYTFSQQGIRNLRENLRVVLPILEKQSKEIEDNKKYIDLHYVPYEQYTSKLNELNKKWEDKIRLKMKQEMDKGYRLSEERHLQNYAYDRLKELLEE